jgi:predicted Zn-dependent protease
MAQITEGLDARSAFDWRKRVVDLKPESTDDRFALTKAAMRVGNLSAATNALDGIDAAGRNTTEYHNIAGILAIAGNQPAQAESHFLEASRLSPGELAPKLSLSIVRLQSTNAQSVADARTALKTISANPTNSSLRCQALRELAADALRNKQNNDALAFTRALLQETNSVFRDRTLHLDVLQQSRSPEFRSALATFQREAANSPRDIGIMAQWQITNSTPVEVLQWLQTLPEKSRTNAPANMAIAACLNTIKQWPQLHTFLANQNWSDLGFEFLRHAYLARSLREREMPAPAKAEWELALKDANNQKASLTALALTAESWKWRTEYEETLWIIVNRYAEEKWALQALSQALYAGGRTRPLMMLFSQELKRQPSNLAIKNNLTTTALLLDARELRPHEMAHQIYQAAPTNSTFASTYAFSLYLLEKYPEALKVMQALPQKDLEHPAIAGYYGLILAATGDKQKARPYLDWAFKAQLLPEERKLFEKAKASI